MSKAKSVVKVETVKAKPQAPAKKQINTNTKKVLAMQLMAARVARINK